MIAWIATRLLGLGVPERFARAAAWLIIVIVAIGALWLAKTAYDASLIKSHDAAIVAQDAPVTRAADEHAAVDRRADDARLSNETTALEKVTQDAPDAPLSDARRRYYDCVRLQQRARTTGGDTPACD